MRIVLRTAAGFGALGLAVVSVPPFMLTVGLWSACSALAIYAGTSAYPDERTSG